MATTTITVEEDDSTSISADGYPHIIDEIFGYAPRSTLLALRGVCKAWRDRVDLLMAGHIVLAVYSPVEISGRGGVRIPGLKNRRNYARVLSGTRVVDLLGPQSLSPDRVKALRSQLNDVSVVRHRHHPAGRLPNNALVGARTLVTFTTVTEKYEGGTFTGAAAVGPLPEACERFVLNVKFDPGRSWLSTASVQPFQTPAQLKSVTLILTPIATHKEDENDHWVGNFVDSSRTKVMGMLNSFVLNMTLNIPRLRYTIVDAEQLRPAWLGFAPEDMQALEEAWLDNFGVIPAREEVLVAEIRRQVKQGLKKWNQVDDETAEKQVEEHVRFLTRDQYRDEVGEEEYLLETVE
ncbi:hypothetical protein A1Q2_00503 [Trichosporon asahii var. asahii CBS 8904]|uniref:Uncharacterized protein n=2 Tax=Trichosporon asahii var. asahii TaxID=189963 RepID=K1W8X8_TRIAC|nr:hypothetical protein A1Q1_04855 [Trichosporon asahii var. asahii CBS 2479]EJT46560.1 hypothetical protein A1Q1_04855 [Trichosporon asahii var. asahii CBS 2479]EKD05273.1 hypothetical protein A1Q2_00503 [Trichosporon asahii var. asahii CBS 8904]